MNNEFLIVDLRKDILLGEMTLGDFVEWVEDTDQFNEWGQKYNRNYAIKRMRHDLEVLCDYSKANNVEVEWNKFSFISVQKT